MSSRSTYLDDDLEEILEHLNRNTGRIITVFTRSGGCSGRGFTGLLVRVDCDTIKLITAFPSAPRHPFGRSFEFGSFGFNDRCCRDRFGTAIVIPIRQIVSVVFNEI